MKRRFLVRPLAVFCAAAAAVCPFAPSVQAEEAAASEQAETQTPETTAPETQTPETQAPETATPETEAPETETQKATETETGAAEKESQSETAQVPETEGISETQTETETQAKTGETEEESTKKTKEKEETEQAQAETESAWQGVTVDVSSYPAANITENTKEIYAYLTDEMDLNHAAACGVLANIQLESNFQQNVIGDGGSSYGLCQWHNGRWSALSSYCTANGLDVRTVSAQMAYLNYELQTGYPAVLSYLESVPDTAQGAYDAAYYWCVHFEIPSDTYAKAAQRGNLAKEEYYPQSFAEDGDVLEESLQRRIQDTALNAGLITQESSKKSAAKTTEKISGEAENVSRTGEGAEPDAEEEIGVIPEMLMGVNLFDVTDTWDLGTVIKLNAAADH